MYRKMWVSDQRKNLVYVDSYENGVLKGRFYDPEYGNIAFNSLSQFLVSMEQILDEKQIPQSYTEARTFDPRPLATLMEDDALIHRAALATFEIRILFRQNTSWQGSLHWRDRDMDQSFRSVLELIMLLDSALRTE